MKNYGSRQFNRFTEKKYDPENDRNTIYLDDRLSKRRHR